MPNWCNNYLEVTGKEKDLMKFRRKAKRTIKGEVNVLDFAKLYPEPDYKKVEVLPTFPDIRNEVRKGEEWWDWRIQNWGTKWNSCEPELLDQEQDNLLQYRFETAWSPPVELFEKVSKDFPTLKFVLEYEETGMGFKGTATIQNGENDQEEKDIEYLKCPDKECEETWDKDESDTCPLCGKKGVEEI